MGPRALAENKGPFCVWESGAEASGCHSSPMGCWRNAGERGRVRGRRVGQAQHRAPDSLALLPHYQGPLSAHLCPGGGGGSCVLHRNSPKAGAGIGNIGPGSRVNPKLGCQVPL